jgi:transcription-repair coupling factor (superfamily II helicase)
VNIKDIRDKYAAHPLIIQLCGILKSAETPSCGVKGLSGSATSFALGAVSDKLQRSIMIICADAEEANYIHGDLSNIIGSKKTGFFPSTYKRSPLVGHKDSSSVILRTEVLNHLRNGASRSVIVTYPEAVMEFVVSAQIMESKMLQLRLGEKISTEFLNDMLHEYGFVRTDFVFEPGQFAIRGSIVDIFSYSSPDPYRIDFFGDSVDSLRTFDPQNQRSIEQLTDICIVADVQEQCESKVSIFEYLEPGSVIWCRDLAYALGKIGEISDSAIESESSKEIAKQLGSAAWAKQQILRFPLVEQSSVAAIAQQVLAFDTSLQPSFNKNFEFLGTKLEENIESGLRNIFFTDNISQIERLESIFAEINPKAVFESVGLSIHSGFTCHQLQICCYTDHQVFERYHRHQAARSIVSKESMSLKDIYNLAVGDYVVHTDHGIGQFAGLDRIENSGKTQEAIRLVYANSDYVYVSIHSLHKVSKYRGKDGSPPKVHKLGSGAWQRTKEKTKARVKDIAKELIALYAERKAQPGFAFSPDTYLQQELEASFFYEDTPDQLKATKAVKRAMESTMPMDMLVCGDVGFGKTEVAIRAAFKAVAESKQVAVLVPTTILALQHYKTFSTRLKDFPCTVEYISRLRKPADVKRILSDAKMGKVDILIGTHKLVGKDVAFKDLGLLVIDEEQKFGVAVKDKLKNLKVNVDTLTLTATPIPRTLQFSLMGARDLATINTPPPNRHPIQTEVHSFSEDIIREAILNEVRRGGQVFIINNRLDNIYELQNMVHRICPGVKAIVGHGQMDGGKLEKVMLDFINQDYDVLVATTIIEAGLDIPNANTIIINQAQNFGLSDLHQLRGRVGRSNKKAFCYLLAPPPQLQSAEARRRLRAIEEFSELGSGINISMQDLDIRGAGNLLGGEQSGFIADIGYETYQRILDEAMQELRENEYKELYQTGQTAVADLGDDFRFVSDCAIETDSEMLIPPSYVGSAEERIKLYRQLDSLADEEALAEFAEMVRDRFGPVPKQALLLFDVVRLRWKAISLGIEKIILKNEAMNCFFVADQSSLYFQSKVFSSILQYLQHNPRKCSLEEKKGKLMLTVKNIDSIDLAIESLNSFAPRGGGKLN